MKKSLLKGLILVVLLVGVFFFSSNVSAQIAPFLINDGNYVYTDNGNGTGSLTFSSVNPNWATYTNGDSGCAYPSWMGVCTYQDPIIGTDPYGMGTLGSEISFGSLTNSNGSPTVFGSASMSIFEISTGNVFFSATIDNFNTSLTWMNLSNVTSGSAHTTYNSRYVSELLVNGNGLGNIKFSFTPGAGGTEDFIGSSSGSVGITVAAPEPISTVLFITGGATLAVIRMRKKRI